MRARFLFCGLLRQFFFAFSQACLVFSRAGYSFSLLWLRRAFVFAGFRRHLGVRLSAFFSRTLALRDFRFLVSGVNKSFWCLPFSTDFSLRCVLDSFYASISCELDSFHLSSDCVSVWCLIPGYFFLADFFQVACELDFVSPLTGLRMCFGVTVLCFRIPSFRSSV